MSQTKFTLSSSKDFDIKLVPHFLWIKESLMYSKAVVMCDGLIITFLLTMEHVKNSLEWPRDLMQCFIGICISTIVNYMMPKFNLSKRSYLNCVNFQQQKINMRYPYLLTYFRTMWLLPWQMLQLEVSKSTKWFSICLNLWTCMQNNLSLTYQS
jgi:hypothetical protein